MSMGLMIDVSIVCQTIIFSEFLCEELYFGSSLGNIYKSLGFDPCIAFDLGRVKLPKGAKIAPVRI